MKAVLETCADSLPKELKIYLLFYHFFLTPPSSSELVHQLSVLTQSREEKYLCAPVDF